MTYSPLCEKHNFQIIPNANGQPMKLHRQRGNVTEFLFHISDDQLTNYHLYWHIYLHIYIHIYIHFFLIFLITCLLGNIARKEYVLIAYGSEMVNAKFYYL